MALLALGPNFVVVYVIAFPSAALTSVFWLPAMTLQAYILVFPATLIIALLRSRPWLLRLRNILHRVLDIIIQNSRRRGRELNYDHEGPTKVIDSVHESGDGISNTSCRKHSGIQGGIKSDETGSNL